MSNNWFRIIAVMSRSNGDEAKRSAESSGRTWDKIKGLLGFGPECANGGRRRTSGNCECPRYYNGLLCENIVCINNGTVVDDKCVCDNPAYISGDHCEILKCANAGEPGLNGSCKCLANWYQGRFCEHYSTSWLYLISVPIAILLLVFFVCIATRLFCAPSKRGQRRPADEERRRSRGGTHRPTQAPVDIPPLPAANPVLMRRMRHPLADPHCSSSNMGECPAGRLILPQPPPYSANEQRRVDSRSPLFSNNGGDGIKVELSAPPPPAYRDVVANLERYPSIDPSLTSNV